ncbi:MAG: hypothetical protein AAB530_02610, partial [Patescibacteria group bacterium]
QYEYELKIEEAKEADELKMKEAKEADELKLKKIREESLEEGKKEKIDLIEHKLSDFNINLKELNSVEGYKDLSVGQILLILENLKQITFSNIKEQAKKDFKEEMNKSVKGFFNNIGNFANKVRKGITKGYQISKLEKIKQKNIQKGGFEVFEKDLKQLIKAAVENNLDVVIIDNEDSTYSFEINYINIKKEYLDRKEKFENQSEIKYGDYHRNNEDEEVLSEENLTEEQKAKLILKNTIRDEYSNEETEFNNKIGNFKIEATKFNKIATYFSQIPYEWSLETATKEQQEEYKNIQEEYNKSRKNILNLEKIEKGEKETALNINDIDRKVQYNQFLTSHPEIEKEFKKLGKTEIWKIIDLVYAERTRIGYTAAGYGVRSFAMSIGAYIALPLVAATIGGVFGRKRAKDALRERELEMRVGEKKTKGMTKEEKKEFDEKNIKKQEKTRNAKISIEKNFIDADASVEKINHLIKKIEKIDILIEKSENKNEKDKLEEKKITLINLLETRKEYTQNKINDGLINFGKEDVRLENKLNLIQFLSRAEIETFNNIETGRARIVERLNNILEIRQKKIKKARKKYVNYETMKGACLAASFSMVGLWARDA